MQNFQEKVMSLRMRYRRGQMFISILLLLLPYLTYLAKEFGRTPLVESRNAQKGNEGRDHHPFAFSLWLAGGGIKGGQVIGQTDEFGLNIVEDKIHIHDFHATILHCLGLLHKRLIYRHQGRDFRLTDVAGEVVTRLLV
jgi:hypothetical protein